jgi:hypothetical protein
MFTAGHDADISGERNPEEFVPLAHEVDGGSHDQGCALCGRHRQSGHEGLAGTGGSTTTPRFLQRIQASRAFVWYAWGWGMARGARAMRR